MPPRGKASEFDSSVELARKFEILEREMATQRQAMERLKQMAIAREKDRESTLRMRRRSA